jgi:hypothetical protein
VVLDTEVREHSFEKSVCGIQTTAIGLAVYAATSSWHKCLWPSKEALAVLIPLASASILGQVNHFKFETKFRQDCTLIEYSLLPLGLHLATAS